MKSKKWLSLVAACLMLATTAIGCAAPSGTGTTGTDTATQAPAADAPAKTDAPAADATKAADAAATPAVEPAGANGAANILLSTVADPKMLDPALASDGESGAVIDRVFDSLMRYKADGSVEPSLAESYEVSSDATVYTFKIRSGVKFHDGTDCDATAIKWNYDRQLEGKATPDMPYAASFWAKVASVEAPDASTLVMTLKNPDSTFIVYLAQKIGIGAVFSPTAWQADPEGAKRKPIGTGPYKFKEWVTDQYVVLEANPDYYFGTPKNGSITLKIIKESAVRTSELVAASIDAIPSNIDLNDLPMLSATEGIKIGSKPGNNISYMAFVDYEKEGRIFKDKKLREAIWCAIDRDALVKGLYGENAVVAQSMIPPTMNGGDGSFTQTKYDPEKAKALMTEAGHPDGFSFTLLSYNVTKGYNPAAERLAVAIQNELAKVNIKCSITIEPWSEYLTSTYGEECKYDAVMAGWGAATNDTSYMFELLMSANAGTGPNHAAYKSQVVDDALAAAMKSTDAKAQRDEYIKAAQQVNEDMPWLILSHGKDYWAYRDYMDVEGRMGVWGTHDEEYVKNK